jgi:hypothetical protein
LISEAIRLVQEIGDENLGFVALNVSVCLNDVGIGDRVLSLVSKRLNARAYLGGNVLSIGDEGAIDHRMATRLG